MKFFWYIVGGCASGAAVIVFLCYCLYWARYPGRQKRAKGGEGSEDPEEEIRRQIGTMDKILVFMGVFLLLFVVTMIVLFTIFQSVPDTLIVSVFGACGFECGAMAAIQNRKTAARAKLEEIQNEKRKKEESPCYTKRRSDQRPQAAGEEARRAGHDLPRKQCVR